MWFKHDETESDIYYCNARLSNQQNESLVVIRVSINEITPNTDDTTATTKRKRRQTFRYSSPSSPKSNWLPEQNKFAKQCQSSFSMLEKNSLSFTNDYWQGCMVCKVCVKCLKHIYY